jgi:hypothetical protein
VQRDIKIGQNIFSFFALFEGLGTVTSIYTSVLRIKSTITLSDELINSSGLPVK